MNSSLRFLHLLVKAEAVLAAEDEEDGVAGAAVEAEALEPVSLRGTLGSEVEAETLLHLLAVEHDALERQFRAYGFAPIRQGWLTHAARLGEVITARTMRDTMTGTFEDVDGEGRLILKTADGTKTVTAADVFFD